MFDTDSPFPVSTFDLVKRIEQHILAIRRAPYYAACGGRAHIAVAEQALAAVVAGQPELDEYPIRRPKRNQDYHGPRPGPGQTVMLCPTEHKMMLFNFRPFQMLECNECGFRISREEAT